MTRRDTIIIATLVNAGLLACLFVTATRQDSLLPDTYSEGYEIAEATPLPKEETSSYVVDEVDLALKEFLPDDTKLIENENGIESDLNPEIMPERIPEKIEPESISTPSYPSKDTTTKYDGKTVDVTVKKGDMLEKIARANGTTVKAIKQASNLTSDTLKVGQVLKVPVGQKAPVQEKPKAEPVASLDGDPVYYTVQSGDNPWKIAKKFHVKFEDILKLNQMTEEKSKNLKVGQEIRVK